MVCDAIVDMTLDDLATIHTSQTDDRRTHHCTISATVSTVG